MYYIGEMPLGSDHCATRVCKKWGPGMAFGLFAVLFRGEEDLCDISVQLVKYSFIIHSTSIGPEATRV